MAKHRKFTSATKARIVLKMLSGVKINSAASRE